MEAHEKKPNSRLRRERDLKGWSQATLAEKVGTSEQGVNRWENGHHKPNRYFQTQLCQVFGKDAQELGFMDDPQTATAEQESQTDPEKEQKVEHSLSLSQASSVDTGEGVHEPDGHNEQRTHEPRTLLLLPCSVVQPATSQEAVLLDGTTFGIAFARIITLIHQWHGMALFCHDLQARLDQEIKELDMLKLQYPLEQYTLSRHDFLATLATLPIALLAETKQAHKTVLVVEEFLPQCAVSLTACWHLSRGSHLETIPPMLDSFLPTLLSIIKHVPTYREVAVDLVAQCYRLKAMLAWHLEGLGQAETYCLQALKYSVMANNPNLRISALSRLAVIAYYDGNFSQGLTKSESALAILQQTDQSQVSPVVKGQVYMYLAALQAYHRSKRQAEQSLENAQKAFTAQSSHEPIPLYLDWGTLLITLWGGLTHYYLGQDDSKHAEQAWSVLKQFGQLEPSSAISERSRLECLNSRALAAIQLNEMEEAIACFEAAKQGSRDLGSKQRSAEIVHVYSEMLKRWPSERRIVTLEPSAQQ